MTSNPDEACIFLVFVDDNINTSEPFDLSWLPHWNGGRNHVLVRFTDDANRVVSHDAIGNASLMATTGLFETNYRSEFDIGIPVPGRVQMPVLQVVMPLARKYFATFKGVRVVEREIGNVRSTEEFRALHNADDGVVVVTSCNHVSVSACLPVCLLSLSISVNFTSPIVHSLKMNLFHNWISKFLGPMLHAHLTQKPLLATDYY